MRYKFYSAFRIRISALFVFFFMAASLFGQVTNIAAQPAPDWVRPLTWLAPDKPMKNGKAEGSRCLLYEYQENPQQEEQFSRVILLMENETGVQDAGNLTFKFNPAFQKLILHQVQIRRGGQVLDRLDTSKVKIIQPETDLNQHLFTGQQTALLFVEDLRVGDTLEYAFTLRGANPVFNGHYSNVFIVQGGIPVDRQRLRILWPADKPLYMRQHLIDMVPGKVLQSGMTEYTWDFSDLAAIPYEDALPSRYEPYPYVELSDFSDWARVVDWALPLYAAESTNMPPELRALITQWKNSEVSSEERVRTVLQFVQDEVRYTGLEFGSGSHCPAHPFETFQLRYGDCKGKASLLCTILREMHIEAYPALVNATVREAVANRLPSPSAFDHVIVKLVLNGKTIWVDPTRAHQGGVLSARYLPVFGKALVIEKGVTALEDISQPPGTSRQRVVSTFDLKDYDAPASLTVKTSYGGWEADNIREYFARTDMKDVTKNSLNFLMRYYPGISEARPMEVIDYRAGNMLEVTEHYSIKDLWTTNKATSQLEAVFYAENLNDILTDPRVRSRKMPLGLVYPLHREQEIVVHLPDSEWNIPALEQTSEDDAFSFRYRRECSGSTVKFSYICDTKTPEVAAEAVGSYLKKREKIQALLANTLYYSGKAAVSGINWLMVVVACFGAATTLACCLWIWRATAVRKPAGTPDGGRFYHRNLRPRSIGGWLGLVGIGICLGPFIHLATLVQGREGYLSMRTWQAVAVSSGGSYHPVWGPLLIFELLGNICLMGLNILLICMFFSKRRVFPKAYIVFTVASLTFLLIDMILAGQVGISGAANGAAMARGITVSVIWCTYMLRSSRVKETFVR